MDAAALQSLDLSIEPQRTQHGLPAPGGDVAMGSPPDNSAALVLAADVGLGPQKPALAQPSQQGALEGGTTQGTRRATLICGCEDGSLWRLDLVWAAGALGAVPATSLRLCYQAVSNEP